jgi:hypothetical protein
MTVGMPRRRNHSSIATWRGAGDAGGGALCAWNGAASVERRACTVHPGWWRHPGRRLVGGGMPDTIF